MVFFLADLHAGDDFDGVLCGVGSPRHGQSNIAMGHRRSGNSVGRRRRTVCLLLLSALPAPISLSGAGAAHWNIGILEKQI